MTSHLRVSTEEQATGGLGRPQLQDALARLHEIPVDGIVVAKLDRLSRSVRFFSGVSNWLLLASGRSSLSTLAWTSAPRPASSWPTT